jgi:carbamoylphosphate synthase large subunit
LILEKITQNGFSVELDGDSFTVAPSDQLTDQQREFLKANKPQIMRELLLTTVYNLYGVPMQIQAKDAQHKAWLIKVNHKTSTPVTLTKYWENDNWHYDQF